MATWRSELLARMSVARAVQLVRDPRGDGMGRAVNAVDHPSCSSPGAPSNLLADPVAATEIDRGTRYAVTAAGAPLRNAAWTG